jgi:hypothetical protein
MPKSNQQQFNQLTEDMAVMKTEFKNFNKNFEGFLINYQRYCEKVDIVENKQIAVETKVGNLAVFQSIFSIIIGAIATYLGAKR